MQSLKKLLCGMQDNGKDLPNEIVSAIVPLIEKTSQEIFKEYSTTFVREDTSFVAQAVWGMGEGNNGLTREQAEINRKILPVLESTISLWKRKESDVAQLFAVDYLVRTIIMTKILFMTEMLRSRMYVMRSASDEKMTNLLYLEPAGHA